MYALRTVVTRPINQKFSVMEAHQFPISKTPPIIDLSRYPNSLSIITIAQFRDISEVANENDSTMRASLAIYESEATTTLVDKQMSSAAVC